MTKELPKSVVNPALEEVGRQHEATEELLWTVPDVARLLRASTSWVYKAAERDQLPYIRIGAMLRFEPAAIRAWLAARRSREH